MTWKAGRQGHALEGRQGHGLEGRQGHDLEGGQRQVSDVCVNPTTTESRSKTRERNTAAAHVVSAVVDEVRDSVCEPYNTVPVWGFW